MAEPLVHISEFASLAVIAALLASGLVASLVADRLEPPHAVERGDSTSAAMPEGARDSDSCTRSMAKMILQLIDVVAVDARGGCDVGPPFCDL